MKKFLLNSFNHFIFTLIFISLTFIECNKSKNVDQSSIDQATKSNILEYLKSQQKVSYEAETFIDTLKKSAQWDNIFISPINYVENIIYIPVKYNSNKAGLVFIVNAKNNAIETAYLSEVKYQSNSTGLRSERNIIEPSEVIQNFYKYRMKSFSGSITAYSLSNSHMWEMGYSNGVNTYMKKVIGLLNAPSVKNIQIKTNGVSNGEPIKKISNDCVAYYLVTYWSDGTADYLYIGGYCTNPCQLNIAISNDTIMRIKAYCGGGSVGGSGGGGSASTITDVKYKITDPCLKNIIKNFMTKGVSNAITNILTSVFGASDQINIVFNQSTNVVNSSGVPIDAKTSESISGGVKDENIILNISTLINNSAGPVSEQYIASTIIHEIIHAYINNNPTIFNASPSQHLTMLQNYIPTMATALISFYPDLSLADAVSLSLGGLEDLNLSTDASGGSIYNSPTFSSILSSLNTQFQINLNSDPNSRASYQFTASFYQAGGQSGTHCAGGGKVL